MLGIGLYQQTIIPIQEQADYAVKLEGHLVQDNIKSSWSWLIQGHRPFSSMESQFKFRDS